MQAVRRAHRSARTLALFDALDLGGDDTRRRSTMSTPTKKPWWAEREFIFAVGAIIGGIALIAQGNLWEGVALMTGGTGTFNISRGIAKRPAVPGKETP
jgi:hypothetical protein